MSKGLKNIAEECHANVFSTDPRRQTESIEKHYALNAVFEDPLVYVTGRSNIRLQFRILSTLFSSIRTTVTRVAEENRSGGTSVVIIDAQIIFTVLGLLPFTLRDLSTFEFGPDGKIVRHEDVWSLKDLIAAVPFVGPVYDRGLRWTVGEVSNRVAEALGGLKL